MKIGKLFTAFAVAIMLIPFAGMAQRPAKQPDCRMRPPRGHLDPVVQYRNEEIALFNALELTDAQKSSVKAIRSDYGSKKDKLIDKTRKQMEKNEKAFLKKMKKALTPQQYEKFIKIRDAQKVRRGGKTEAGYRCGQNQCGRFGEGFNCDDTCLPACSSCCPREECAGETECGLGPITKGPTPQLMTE